MIPRTLFLITVLLLINFSFTISYSVEAAVRRANVNTEENPVIHSRQKRAVGNPHVIQQSEIDSAVRRHNEYRAMQNASNMEYMEWNSELARLSQAHVEKCGFEKSDTVDKGYNISYLQVGQNLRYHVSTQGNLEDAVDAWYSQIEFFSRESGSCSGQTCDYFSQVVWFDSEIVGCGRVMCPNLTMADGSTTTNAVYTACSYAAPGNTKGVTPFLTGPPCSDCAKGYETCRMGLCYKDQTFMNEIIGDCDLVMQLTEVGKHLVQMIAKLMENETQSVHIEETLLQLINGTHDPQMLSNMLHMIAEWVANGTMMRERKPHFLQIVLQFVNGTHDPQMWSNMLHMMAEWVGNGTMVGEGKSNVVQTLLHFVKGPHDPQNWANMFHMMAEWVGNGIMMPEGEPNFLQIVLQLVNGTHDPQMWSNMLYMMAEWVGNGTMMWESEPNFLQKVLHLVNGTNDPQMWSNVLQMMAEWMGNGAMMEEGKPGFLHMVLQLVNGTHDPQMWSNVLQMMTEWVANGTHDPQMWSNVLQMMTEWVANGTMMREGEPNIMHMVLQLVNGTHDPQMLSNMLQMMTELVANGTLMREGEPNFLQVLLQLVNGTHNPQMLSNMLQMMTELVANGTMMGKGTPNFLQVILQLVNGTHDPQMLSNMLQMMTEWVANGTLMREGEPNIMLMVLQLVNGTHDPQMLSNVLQMMAKWVGNGAMMEEGKPDFLPMIVQLVNGTHDPQMWSNMLHMMAEWVANGTMMGKGKSNFLRTLLQLVNGTHDTKLWSSVVDMLSTLAYNGTHGSSAFLQRVTQFLGNETHDMAILPNLLRMVDNGTDVGKMATSLLNLITQLMGNSGQSSQSFVVSTVLRWVGQTLRNVQTVNETESNLLKMVAQILEFGANLAETSHVEWMEIERRFFETGPQVLQALIQLGNSGTAAENIDLNLLKSLVMFVKFSGIGPTLLQKVTQLLANGTYEMPMGGMLTVCNFLQRVPQFVANVQEITPILSRMVAKFMENGTYMVELGTNVLYSVTTIVTNGTKFEKMLGITSVLKRVTDLLISGIKQAINARESGDKETVIKDDKDEKVTTPATEETKIGGGGDDNAGSYMGIFHGYSIVILLGIFSFAF